MRCFIAVELPSAAHHALRTLQRELALFLDHSGAGHVVRWTAPESIHLTLRFLGETSERQSEAIIAGLHATARALPITLSLQGIGCFPHCRRPNVVWAGVVGALDPLRSLQCVLEETARAAGFEPEDRLFTPHLTLGRTRRESTPADLKRAGALLLQAAALPFVRTWSAPLQIESVSLMHSDLRPTGAVYTALERVPLRP